MKEIVKLILFVMFVGLFISTAISVRSCQSYKAQAELFNKNIVALNDTIRTYKSKSGSMVNTTTIYSVNDYDQLKDLCQELYDQVKDLKQKNLTSAVSYESSVSVQPTDTSWVVNDTTKHFSRDFIFKDDYRELSGNIYLNMDTLGINVQKDYFKLDYTVAVDEKNNVYIKTDNPYVTINKIKGFTIPKPRQKRWGIGVNTSVSFDPINTRVIPTVGIGLSYNLINF